ncbi:MAG TPA: tRNA (adenosine(37)-N6)-dimethylallyltransferase MiaA [Planctomycetota bacterium]|nr:tRNA (adenosine(37)-N6)-dimethylallyltransferase MiaA [Planctomycetota bacterium]
MPERASLLILTGPSASGKESVALEIARRVGGEIISLDSMKIYREIDIATAKPDLETRRRVPHHLIDIVDPDVDFSTGDYLPLLERAIDDVRARGRFPIVSGGTALYLVAWLQGLAELPPADWSVRSRLIEEGEALGPEALHARLSAIDPEAASRLLPRDLRRIVRALEVWETTGRPISSYWEWSSYELPQGARLFGIEWSRRELHARIDARVLRMVERGLFEEAERLLHRTPPLGRSARQCIGLKEIFEAEREGLDRDAVIERIQRNTRRFVKRQMTWFRKLPIEWIPVSGSIDPEAVASTVLERSALVSTS